jgi:hypothetical protein
MSHADEMAAGEVTGRTAIAVDAHMEAYKAQMNVLGLRRHVTRVNWVWGVLAFLGVVGGGGYTLRDRLDHFAAKEKLEQATDRIDRQERELTGVREQLRGIVATQQRTLDGVDEVKRILMSDHHGRSR